MENIVFSIVLNGLGLVLLSYPILLFVFSARSLTLNKATFFYYKNYYNILFIGYIVIGNVILLIRALNSGLTLRFNFLGLMLTIWIIVDTYRSMRKYKIYCVNRQQFNTVLEEIFNQNNIEYEINNNHKNKRLTIYRLKYINNQLYIEYGYFGNITISIIDSWNRKEIKYKILNNINRYYLENNNTNGEKKYSIMNIIFYGIISSIIIFIIISLNIAVNNI